MGNIFYTYILIFPLFAFSGYVKTQKATQSKFNPLI